ncbi:hypothetical protein [Bifidobacterium callitrichidarum]|uniref:Uncharacterized protein n=1 Tax=Bifidobacterium callitrichidarum TaxID=2052941 RepID=A0A2U2N923_9BIFI|nr:hypothetical protein [Bifidobacterium callitrichidarum]PWG65602.1 hypothetical protein DF196_06625 [Bifidobacterium callitrichidarum]
MSEANWWDSMSFDRLVCQPVRVTISGRRLTGLLRAYGDLLTVDSIPVFEDADNGHVTLRPEVESVVRLSVNDYEGAVRSEAVVREHLVDARTRATRLAAELTSTIGGLECADADERARRTAAWHRIRTAFDDVDATIGGLLGENVNVAD